MAHVTLVETPAEIGIVWDEPSTDVAVASTDVDTPDVVVHDVPAYALTSMEIVPTPTAWEAHAVGSAAGAATGDVTVTATGDATGTGSARAVLPATWAAFHTAYPTWADRNGLTWAQLTEGAA